MKFLVPNYSFLQNPWLGGNRPQIPVLSVLCPQLNLLNPPGTKFLCTPLVCIAFGIQRAMQMRHIAICGLCGSTIFFPQSMYFPKNVLRNATHLTHKIPTCFGIQVPSSGSYSNKGVWANLLIYVLLLVTRLINTLAVKIHKMCEIYKNKIVNNLQYFYHKKYCKLLQNIVNY